MPEEDFHFEDKKAESFDSSTNAAEGHFLEESRLNLIEKSRRGRFAEANERRARTMLWLAIGFFVAVSLPYLVVLYLAVGGLLSPNALDVSVSLKRIIRILDFPIYILALPFVVSVALRFWRGSSRGCGARGRSVQSGWILARMVGRVCPYKMQFPSPMRPRDATL